VAIELAPFWAEPYLERASLYESENDPDRALADLEKALRVPPKAAVRCPAPRQGRPTPPRRESRGLPYWTSGSIL
jgi:tetratricopeptide (TPR) repeat protein